MSEFESLAIFDLNNMVIRAHSGMMKSGLSTADGTQTGGLFGAIRVFNGYIQKLQPTHVACFWDYGRSTFRTAIAQDYKGDRPTSSYLEPGDVQNTFRLFEEYLDLIRVFHHKEAGIEADDLIADCVIQHQNDVPITILSADHDLRQLVRQPDPYPVTVIKPSMSSTKPNEYTYTYQSVIDEYKLPPHRLAEIWAIEGDSGDNIFGVPKYGPVKSLKVLQEFGSLSNAIANHPGFAGYEQKIHQNYRMIKLPSEVVPSYRPRLTELLVLEQWEKRLDGLEAFFKKYEFQSLVLKLEAGTLFIPEDKTTMRTGFGAL